MMGTLVWGPLPSLPHHLFTVISGRFINFPFFSWANESGNKRYLTGLLLRSSEIFMKSSLVDTCNMKLFTVLFLLVGLYNRVHM